MFTEKHSLQQILHPHPGNAPRDRRSTELGFHIVWWRTPLISRPHRNTHAGESLSSQVKSGSIRGRNKNHAYVNFITGGEGLKKINRIHKR